VFPVDRREPIHVEYNHGGGVAEAPGANQFLGEHRFEQRSGIQRRQRVDHRDGARVELSELGGGAKEIEGRAANDLRHDRPRFGGGTGGFVQRELVERGAFGQIREREQPFHRQPAFDEHPPHVGHQGTA
jgi:hypothetical protein